MTELSPTASGAGQQRGELNVPARQPVDRPTGEREQLGCATITSRVVSVRCY